MSAPESPSQPQDGSQRAMLISLLTDMFREALGSLREEHGFAEIDLAAQRRLGNSGPNSTTDERLQADATTRLKLFEESCKSLDEVLLRVANDAHQLGSSVRIVSAALSMRLHLNKLSGILRQHVEPLATGSHDPSRLHGGHIELVLDESVLPEALRRFADCVERLIACLYEFPKFEDVSDRKPLHTLKVDLEYWSSRTHTHQRNLTRTEVRMYLLNIMSEMGNEITSVSTSLASFTASGIPVLLSLQSKKIENKLNLIQIAAFLSSVTATCIGFSFGKNDTAVATAVNGFWFTSLALSTLTIINLLLGVSWHRSVYRLAVKETPFIVKFWLNISPPTFLALSVLNFSIGFVLFSWSTSQHTPVIAITVVLTGIMLFGFLAAFTWLFYERKVSKRMEWSKKMAQSVASAFGELRRRAANIPLHPADIASRSLSTTRKDSSTELEEHLYAPRFSLSAEKPQVMPQESKFQLAKRLLGIPVSRVHNMQRLFSIAISAQREMSVRMLTQRLKTIKMVDEEPDGHTGAINHLQFSPDGSRLVTTGRDQRSLLYKFNDKKPRLWRTMVHIDGDIHQIDWSPGGGYFLARLDSSIEIWTNDGVLFKSYPRRNSRAVSWFPTADSPGALHAGCFLSVEDGKIVRLHKDAGYRTEYLANYLTGQLDVQDLEVTNDGRRFIAIGKLTPLPSQPKPIKGKVEKQILVYNMETQEVEYCVPVSRDVHDITLSQNGIYALVSYRKKAPPQLWNLEVERGTDRPRASLTLMQTYLPEEDAVSFAGPSHFGGENDQLVLCASKVGDVYIWHTRTGKLLRHISAAEGIGADLSCISGSRTESPFTIATGSVSGTLQIWTKNISDMGPSPIAARVAGRRLNNEQPP